MTAPIESIFLTRSWTGEPVNAEPHRCAQLGWFPLDCLPQPMVPYAAAAIGHVLAGRLFSTFGTWT
ncbi:hypothetical protein [Carbonactinospora thermoautotrophica]|uniref:hypothetical protein n=1 Tax=Carbonactinospora thermoautotrophica TaxID=1469144 RepID=UPI002270E6C0|nr:hypothetical protein [Carbonactinospora thermoautotrophica]